MPRYFARIIDRLYRLVLPGPPLGSVESIINTCLAGYEEVRFIQIGAHDGVSGDVLHSFIDDVKWRGTFVEPVPYLFDRLVNNVDDKTGRFVFVNAAVDSASGYRTFYSIKETLDPSVPRWHTQLGSLDRQTILKHSDQIEQLEERIVELTVRSVSVRELMTKHGPLSPDLILIDTEGYDAVILENLLDEGIRPSILVFEHKHLRWHIYRRLVLRLKSEGYCLVRDGGNTVAHSK